jgi:hypothetical protein
MAVNFEVQEGRDSVMSYVNDLSIRRSKGREASGNLSEDSRRQNQNTKLQLSGKDRITLTLLLFRGFMTDFKRS